MPAATGCAGCRPFSARPRRNQEPPHDPQDHRSPRSPRLPLIGAARQAQAQTPRRLRIGLREDPDILDPTLARTFVGRIVFASLCDKLFDINEKLEIVPQLATGYRWEDPKTLLITLRDGRALP